MQRAARLVLPLLSLPDCNVGNSCEPLTFRRAPSSWPIMLVCSITVIDRYARSCVCKDAILNYHSIVLSIDTGQPCAAPIYCS